VQVITPNPKTSGGARWNYLAAWGYALRQPGGNEAKAKDLVTRIYKTCLFSIRALAARLPHSWSAVSVTCSSRGRTKPSRD
jgi:sulfate transport system substrate-binding protein